MDGYSDKYSGLCNDVALFMSYFVSYYPMTYLIYLAFVILEIEVYRS